MRNIGKLRTGVWQSFMKAGRLHRTNKNRTLKNENGDRINSVVLILVLTEGVL